MRSVSHVPVFMIALGLGVILGGNSGQDYQRHKDEAIFSKSYNAGYTRGRTEHIQQYEEEKFQIWSDENKNELTLAKLGYNWMHRAEADEAQIKKLQAQNAVWKQLVDTQSQLLGSLHFTNQPGARVPLVSQSNEVLGK